MHAFLVGGQARGSLSVDCMHQSRNDISFLSTAKTIFPSPKKKVVLREPAPGSTHSPCWTMALFRRKRRRIWSHRICCWTAICLGWSLVARADTTTTDADKGSLDVQTFCKASKIKVRKVILLCDSPGAYYYGSNTYRNSRVCMSNDKANLQLYCE